MVVRLKLWLQPLPLSTRNSTSSLKPFIFQIKVFFCFHFWDISCVLGYVCFTLGSSSHSTACSNWFPHPNSFHIRSIIDTPINCISGAFTLVLNGTSTKNATSKNACSPPKALKRTWVGPRSEWTRRSQAIMTGRSQRASLSGQPAVHQHPSWNVCLDWENNQGDLTSEKIL